MLTESGGPGVGRDLGKKVKTISWKIFAMELQSYSALSRAVGYETSG